MKTMSDWLQEARTLDADGKEKLYRDHFFRDPERDVVQHRARFLAPADGTVIYQKEVDPNERVVEVKGRNFTVRDLLFNPYYGQRSLVIGIFMTIWDVHINRMPVDGTVCFEDLPAIHTKNKSMTPFELGIFERQEIDFKENEYLFTNARRLNTVTGSAICPKFFIVQIADEEVDTIVHFKEQGTKFEQGDRFAMIRWGSQVDVVIPLPLYHPFTYKPLVPNFCHVEAGMDALFSLEIDSRFGV